MPTRLTAAVPKAYLNLKSKTLFTMVPFQKLRKLNNLIIIMTLTQYGTTMVESEMVFYLKVKNSW